MQISTLKNVQKFYPRVKTLVDADKPVVITVTENDQITGHIMEETECALAVACKRQFKGGAIIGLSASYIIKGTRAIRYKTSNSISREIVTFDRHKDFSPGVYTLVPFSPANRLQNRTRKYKPGSGETPTKSRIAYHLTTRVRRKNTVKE